MTVAYPLSLPAGVVSVSFEANAMITVNRSPFTLQSWLQDWGGDRWLVSVTVNTRTPKDVSAWRGFFASLAGGRGSFLAHDPFYPGPTGLVSTNAAVNGGNQRGTQLNVRNFQANKTGVLKSGDYFSIANRLYVVLADSDSDGLGDCLVPIFPSLRDAPGDSTALNFAKPKGRFRLLDYNLSQQAQGFYTINFTGEEDI